MKLKQFEQSDSVTERYNPKDINLDDADKKYLDDLFHGNLPKVGGKRKELKVGSDLNMSTKALPRNLKVFQVTGSFISAVEVKAGPYTKIYSFDYDGDCEVVELPTITIKALTKFLKW